MHTFFRSTFVAALLSLPLLATAGNGEIIIGSVLGGATGAIIGNNLGGRDGAIVGGAIGAAAGVAIANEGRRSDHDDRYDRRYVGGYDRDDDDDRHRRYDGRRYDQYGRVIVVETPRHHYRGNQFVYGVPQHYDNGRHRGWDDRRHSRWDDDRRHRNHRHDRHCDHRRDVVIIQPAPRRW